MVMVVSIILTGLFIRKYEYGFLEAWWLGSGYACPVLTLTVLGPLVIFRKRKGRIDCDERDLAVDRQAMIIAFGTTYVFFIAVCFTTWVAAGLDKPIPAYWLVRIVLGGWVTSIVAHAVTTLVCYGRGIKSGQE
jgi:hypothetical protein